MNITLKLVPEDEKEILRNLLEKYDYEFSQYDNLHVNKLGLFGYRYLDHYWSENGRWAYFIEVDGKLAGFVMVVNRAGESSDADFSMAEFFVMYPYRRLGVGRVAFFKTLKLHKGNWQLKYMPKNIASAYFWNNVVDEYTNGNFELIKSHPDAEYADGSLGDILSFKS